MKRPFNQLDVPDWFEHCHWQVEEVCRELPHVVGELTLYPNGNANIGGKMFSQGVPIDNCSFAGGFAANRRSDRLEWLVIRTPRGTHDYYKYRKLIGVWERYFPLANPALDRCVRHFGPRLGSMVHRVDAELQSMRVFMLSKALETMQAGFGCLMILGMGAALLGLLRLFFWVLAIFGVK